MRKFLTTAALLLLVACAGAKLRTNALLPTVAAIWPSVVASLSESPQPLQDAAQAVSIAIESGDSLTVFESPWRLVTAFLDHRITLRVQAGEISPAIGAILMEKVILLNSALEVLGGPE